MLCAMSLTKSYIFFIVSFFSRHFVCSPRWFNVLNTHMLCALRYASANDEMWSSKWRPPCGCNFYIPISIVHFTIFHTKFINGWCVCCRCCCHRSFIINRKLHKCNVLLVFFSFVVVADDFFCVHIFLSTGKWVEMSFPFHTESSSQPFIHLGVCVFLFSPSGVVPPKKITSSTSRE